MFLSSPLPDRMVDLVFWHPPYWPGFRYSDHPNDFSTATTMTDYLDRLRLGFSAFTDPAESQGALWSC